MRKIAAMVVNLVGVFFIIILARERIVWLSSFDGRTKNWDE